ncbi:MAG: diguanylate cyclase [Thermodesulfobacteriota bacterium]
MSRLLVAGSGLLDSPERRVPLEARGYRIQVAASRAKAIAVILEDPPDLLVAERGFDGGADRELIRAVKASIQKANIPVLLVLSAEEVIRGLDWKAYPVDDFLTTPFGTEELLARLSLAEARLLRVFDNNPLSKLPGNTSILRAIQTSLEKETPAAICYVDIDNFKPYNDRYGFSQGDDVILMVARIVVNVLDELVRDDSFAGHIGGDDFVLIVPEGRVRVVCERILAHFEAVKTMFIAPADLAAGGFVGTDRQGRETRFGLLSLSIAAVTTGGGRFSHSGEVAAAAAGLKHYVKTLDGSNYVVDRRRQ